MESTLTTAARRHERTRERLRLYRKTDKFKAWVQKYRQRPEYKAYQKEYAKRPRYKERQQTEAVKSRRRIYARAYRKKPRARAYLKAYNAKYRKTEKFRSNNKIYMARYRKSDSGKVAKTNHRHLRRTKMKVTDITSGQLRSLIASTRYCVLCCERLTKANRHLDHILPLCSGGLHVRSNIRYICNRCNISRPKNGADIGNLPERTGKNITFIMSMCQDQVVALMQLR